MGVLARTFHPCRVIASFCIDLHPFVSLVGKRHAFCITEHGNSWWYDFSTCMQIFTLSLRKSFPIQSHYSDCNARAGRPRKVRNIQRCPSNRMLGNISPKAKKWKKYWMNVKCGLTGYFARSKSQSLGWTFPLSKKRFIDLMVGLGLGEETKKLKKLKESKKSGQVMAIHGMLADISVKPYLFSTLLIVVLWQISVKNILKYLPGNSIGCGTSWQALLL